MSRSCQSATFSSAAIALRADEPRQAGDLLAADRIALVRHRRRALLPAAERLLDLADLGLLQPADLERELLERRGQDRQRRQQLGVPIALNDLRRHRRGRRGRAARHTAASIDGSRCANMPTAPEILPTDTASRARTQPLAAARDLRVPERELHAERHRLGVHAVRPADHRRARDAPRRARRMAASERVDVLQDQVAGLRASAAPAPCRARRTTSGRSAASAPAGPTRSATAVVNAMTSCCVVCSISSMRAMSNDARSRSVARVGGRHDAGLGQRVGRRQLDLEPGLVPSRVAPDGAHLRVRVARNHRVQTFSCSADSASRRVGPDDRRRQRRRPGTDRAPRAARRRPSRARCPRGSRRA